MANNTFDLEAFASTTYYAPIALGEHECTLGKWKFEEDFKEDGTKTVYLLAPITLKENNRTLDIRFYGIGAKIALDQLRAQLQDNADYKTPLAFMRKQAGKTVKVYISRRAYVTATGEERKTLQYDFEAPTPEEAPVAEAPVETEVADTELI